MAIPRKTRRGSRVVIAFWLADCPWKDNSKVKMVKTDTRLNSLADLALGLNPDPYTNPYQSQTISQPWTLAISNSYTPLSLNRILLSYSYVTQGLVQTIVGQPVDDAFRGGITITSDELSPEEQL